MKDVILEICGFILFCIIGIFIVDACDKNTNTKTNLLFNSNQIDVCGKTINLIDFIDDDEFDSKVFEEYINEICIENPNKDN